MTMHRQDWTQEGSQNSPGPSMNGYNLDLGMMLGEVRAHTSHLIRSVDGIGLRVGRLETRMSALEKGRVPVLEKIIKRAIQALMATAAILTWLHGQDPSSWLHAFPH